MLEEINLEILQNFASLWERVQTGGTGPVSAADPREAVLEQLYALRGGYEDMARQARGGVRQRLWALERETAFMIRHLQAGLFLDAGDTFIPVKRRNFCKFDASYLQKLWRIATELSRACASGKAGADGMAAADLEAAGAMAELQQRAIRDILREIL